MSSHPAPINAATAKTVNIRPMHPEVRHGAGTHVPCTRTRHGPVIKGIPTIRRNTSFGWTRVARDPPSEAATGGAIGVLTPVRIAVEPISRTRRQPGRRQRRNAMNEEHQEKRLL